MARATGDDRTTHCIYCGSAVNVSKGQGDHIIPAAWGEFRNDKPFRQICMPCNHKIGRSEQHMLRCGPETLPRRYVQPASRRGRSMGGWYKGSAGPVHLADSGDHSVLVRPSNANHPENAEPTDNLSILGTDGREYHIELHLGMSVEDLKSRVDRENIGPIKTVWLETGSSGDFDAFEDLVQQAWPNTGVKRLPDTEAGVHSVEGQVQFTLDERCFRALAKIAFHYYLTHTNRGFRGHEPTFEPIRRFIMNGGEIDQFFGCADATFHDGVDVPGGGFMAPPGWRHHLAAQDTTAEAAAFVRLFYGPKFPGLPHTVKLAVLESQILLPSGQGSWFHRYVYYDPQPETGYAGYVEPGSITQA